MPTVTKTVVFTDLANYTARVASMDREGLHQILAEHEALVAPVVERYHGRVVKNLGDSFMCLFDAATDALRAALDVQHLVHDQDGTPIRLAMTTGDVEEIHGDAFGDAVNLASRILSKTPAGEVWFGAGTHLCMNQAEIPWESVGRFRLKGFAGEHQVFRAVPTHKAWLSEKLDAAVKSGTLVRFRRDQRLPLLPPDPVVLLEGFAPGSPALERAVGSLPVLNPASLWLATFNIAPTDRIAWEEAGRGLLVGTPAAIEAAIHESVQAVTRSSGSDTIVLDMSTHAELELVMCGLALPAVPLSDVVAGYSYDLVPDGRWVNRSDRALLRVDVVPEGAIVEALAPGISIDGRAVPPGDKVRLGSGAVIDTPAGRHTYVPGASGYLGLLLADTDMRLGVAAGQTAELGREPNHPGLAFPDRRGQDNIRWCSGSRAARARAGGFTLDRALAGRRQAALQLVGDRIQLTPLHQRCPTYVLQDGQLERAPGPCIVAVDDYVVAGTTVVGLRGPE